MKPWSRKMEQTFAGLVLFSPEIGNEKIAVSMACAVLGIPQREGSLYWRRLKYRITKESLPFATYQDVSNSIEAAISSPDQQKRALEMSREELWRLIEERERMELAIDALSRVEKKAQFDAGKVDMEKVNAIVKSVKDLL